MIQRIQSVYMLIVTGLLIAALCLPICDLMEPNGALYAFKPLGIAFSKGWQSTWGLFSILLITVIIEGLTILCYKVRILQLRMIIFNSLLLVGYYLALVAFYFVLKADFSFTPKFGIILPFIGIVFNYLAARAILRDEAMVHAADRLR